MPNKVSRAMWVMISDVRQEKNVREALQLVEKSVCSCPCRGCDSHSLLSLQGVHTKAYMSGDSVAIRHCEHITWYVMRT